MGKLAEALEKAQLQPRKERESSGEAVESGRDPRAAAGPPVLSRAGFAPDRWDERLRLIADPGAPFFENFRRLRAAILHPSAGQPPRTILVTSLMPGEGKSLVCAGLGVALAEEIERHALLIDCDLRRPNLAVLFGLGNDAGLVDHLRDDVDLSLLIRRTGQPKLSLVPCGRPPRNPAELLSSHKIVSLMDEVTGRYDDRLILFDSSPSMVASETTVLARRVDGVVLVVQWGGAGREAVRKFIDAVGRDKVLGVVFNAYEENRVESLCRRKYGYSGDYYSAAY